MAKTCRKWNYDERLRIVNRYLKEDIGMNSIAAQEGISRGLFWSWIKKYREFGVDGLKTKMSGPQFSLSKSSKDSLQIQKLEYKILQQQIEIERLKKGYYVKGGGESKGFVSIKN